MGTAGGRRRTSGRCGSGWAPQQLATPLVAPETAPVDELEPLTADAMQQFLATHGTLDGLPLAVSLRAFYHLTVSGDPDTVYGAARAMVGQLCTLHSPEDLVVAVSPRAAARGGVGVGEVAAARAADTVRRTAPARGGWSSTTSREIEELLADQLEGRPRFNAAGARRCWTSRTWWSCWTAARCPPDSVLAARRGPAGRHRRRGRARASSTRPRRPGRAGAARHAGAGVRPSGAVYDGAPDALSSRRRRGAGPPARPAAVGLGGDDDEPLLANLDFTDLLNIGDAGSVDVARTWRPARRRPSGCGCRSASARTASRSCWTSRRPRRRAWARTACASARPVPASRSCCARWCSAWRSRTPRRR